MKTQSSRRGAKLGQWIGAAAVAAMFALPVLAYADDPVTMAPPVQADSDQTTADTPENASQDSVFNWSEVPANQQVPITRAVFDQGGYQLYDSVGETIVVPFTDNNLYVMKFGLSDNGTTYFVNDGSNPTLYVPQDAYLENATVPGAKWYPFPQDTEVTTPIFLGVAPSWNAYVDMGWYPDMVCYGGYYCNGPFYAGIGVFPTIGFSFVIGGNHFHDWGAYRSYYTVHAAPYHVGFHDRVVYHWASHSYAGSRTFSGGRDGIPDRGEHGFNNFGGNRSVGGGRQFRGGNGGSYSAHDGAAGGSFSGGAHGFGGNNQQAAPTRSFGGNSAPPAPTHGFGGGTGNVGSHTFQSGPGFGGGSTAIGHSFGGNPTTTGHRFGGGRSFNGARGRSTGGREQGGSQPNVSSSDHSGGGGNQNSGGGGQGGHH